ncbi:UNVERIFIED_CONTAM: hypothetical protein Sindi_2864700, partial [Sesamum indicum]
MRPNIKLPEYARPEKEGPLAHVCLRLFMRSGLQHNPASPLGRVASCSPGCPTNGGKLYVHKEERLS